jgi:16S rRNA (adenine1518-N6/adenine1519-N6)-dimethyltransferase
MVRPKKHLGQHFLRDENIARKIVGSLSGETLNVVEIGPGTGILTKYILQEEKWNSVFFEIDEESVTYLRQQHPAIEKKIILADFLKADLSLIQSPFSVIGNFPYNISSQILFRVLDNRDKVPEVVGMFQKEVAERINAKPGTKDYGILTVLMKAWYDTEYLFTVNETVFFPPPRVKSAVIRMRRNNVTALSCKEELFITVVKTAFNQRRKTLRNALKPLTGKENKVPADIGVLLDLRAERLGVDEFVRLTAWIGGPAE